MIVLDTHAWIGWVSESSKLSATARQAIAQAAESIGIHPISCWEAAMLVAKNRLQFNRDVGEWVELPYSVRRCACCRSPPRKPCWPPDCRAISTVTRRTACWPPLA